MRSFRTTLLAISALFLASCEEVEKTAYVDEEITENGDFIDISFHDYSSNKEDLFYFVEIKGKRKTKLVYEYPNMKKEQIDKFVKNYLETGKIPLLKKQGDSLVYLLK